MSISQVFVAVAVILVTATSAVAQPLGSLKILVMVGAILTNKSAVNLDAVTPITRLSSEYLVIAVPAASKIQTLQGPTEYFCLMVLAFTTVR